MQKSGMFCLLLKSSEFFELHFIKKTEHLFLFG